MSTIVVALLSALILFLGYRFYGGYLARRIFQLDDRNTVPSHEHEDNIDFVPTPRSIVFGHHFTSIAGTGPIVGPAIAVFWGWLPALLWVLFGGIFVGAVHDFGALVVSLRNHGETIGQTAGRLINRRARLLFLFILFFALSVVLGIFGLVIAQVFELYPSSVLGTWASLPLAVVLGLFLRRRTLSSFWLVVVSLVIVYFCVWLGAYHVPVMVRPQEWLTAVGLAGSAPWLNTVVFWTLVLLAYCYAASVLPVWILLQPRDFINSWQLIVALVVLVAAVIWAGLSGQAELTSSTPAIAERMPEGSPNMFPFLFITIACGSISGFHCLVSSGTTSKQVTRESDALPIGYGGMLLESGLAVMVILACCAGIGMGKFQRIESTADNVTKIRFAPIASVAAQAPTDQAPTDQAPTDQAPTDQAPTDQAPALDPTAATLTPWEQRYDPNRKWSDFSLAGKVGAFVDGGASFLSTLAIPIHFGQTVLAVLVACFAATTLDSATRLQRYVIQEIGGNIGVPPLKNRFIATGVAVGVGAVIALMPGAEPGKGGTLLWPLFGATNQLLAGLAFLVIAFYLWRRRLPVYFLVPAMALMLIIPLWALGENLFMPETGYLTGPKPKYLLGFLGLATITLQIWMIIEAVLLFPKVRGQLENKEN